MSERKSVNIGRIVICILIFLTVGVMITPVVASDWTTPTPLLSGMPDIPVKDEFHLAVNDMGEKNIIFSQTSSTSTSAISKIIYVDNTGVQSDLASAISQNIDGSWTGKGVGHPDISIDGQGNLHVTYIEYDSSLSSQSLMYTSRIQGIWTTPTPLLSPNYEYYVHLAVSDMGEKNIIFSQTSGTSTSAISKIIYVDNTGVQSVVASAISQNIDGSWTGKTVYSPDISIDGQGNLHVTYIEIDSPLGSQSLMYTSRIQGIWTTPTPLLSGMPNIPYYVHLAVSDMGEKNIIFYEYFSRTPSNRTEIYKIIYVNNTGVQSVLASLINQNIDGRWIPQSVFPDISIDGQGNLYVTYIEYDSSSRSQSLMYTKKLKSQGVVYKDENGNGKFDFIDTNGNIVWDIGEETLDIQIPNASVSIKKVGEWTSPIKTDINGRYTIGALDSGQYEVNVSYLVDGKETLVRNTTTITVPENFDIGVDYKAVNYGSTNPYYELWHRGPVFDKENAILVHGVQLVLFGSPDTHGEVNNRFGNLAPLLQNKNNGQYNIWEFEYGDEDTGYTYTNLETDAQYLAQAIQKVNDINSDQRTHQNVDALIAHSMGGIISRKTLQDNPSFSSIKLLTLSTAHFGFETTAWAPDIWLYNREAVKDMYPAGSYIWDLNLNYTRGQNTIVEMVDDTDTMVKESSASLIESPSDPAQPIDFNVPSYHFKRTTAGVGHGLNDISKENAPAFPYIKDFLANDFSKFDTTPPNNYNDNPQGWRPYIMFIMASRSVHPDIGFVKDGIETRRISWLGSWVDLDTKYERGSAYDEQGTLTPGWIWMYNAPPNTDYDSIRIYHTRSDYIPVTITPGQSMIVKKLVGNPQGSNTPQVAYSRTLISAADGGEAKADPNGIYTKDGISIPAGAIPTDTLIDIEDPVDDFGLTSAVEISPSMTFSIPATVTVEYKDSDIPQGSDESSMRLLVWEENQWKEVSGSSVNIADKTVSGLTTHLSVYGAGVPQSSHQNQPPDLVKPSDQTITEGNSLSIDLVATDPDNDPLTYSFTSQNTLTGASISGNIFTWNPGSGTAGKYPVTFNVTDTGGLFDEESINITVEAPIQNTKPDLTNPGDKSVSEGSTLQIELTATDPENDPLTYTFTSTEPLNGATLVDNKFTWTPGSGSAGKYSVTFNVTDSGSLSDEETITITVNAPATIIPVKVKILPNPLNIARKGYFIAFVTLPKGYKAADVDATSVKCQEVTALKLVRSKWFPQIFVAIFNRENLAGLPLGNNELTVTGTINKNGKKVGFSGANTIKVISKVIKTKEPVDDVMKMSDDKVFSQFNPR